MSYLIKIGCFIAFCAILNSKSVFAATSTSGCEINIQTDLSRKSPLFIKNNELMIPVAGRLKWAINEKTKVYCTDTREVHTATWHNNFANKKSISNFKFI